MPRRFKVNFDCLRFSSCSMVVVSEGGSTELGGATYSGETGIGFDSLVGWYWGYECAGDCG